MDQQQPDPTQPAAMTIPKLKGEAYGAVLDRLHAILKPRTYFEIGTQDGKSLRSVRARSVAVDPAFRLTGDVVGDKPSCLLFRMTSDAFFAEYDPAALLGGPIDLAFLDGMHLWEFLLRDFLHTERFCRRNSVVLLHDCIPSDVYMAERDTDSPRLKLGRHRGWWTGDVWKTVVALRRHRPDLAIHAFDAHPTGLIAVTNLDPFSTLLPDRYFEIVRDLGPVSLEAYGIDRYWRELDPAPTCALQTAEQIAARFWL